MTRPNYASLFDGLNVAGAMLTLLAALGAIGSTTRMATRLPQLLPATIVVFFAGQLLIVVASVGRARIRFNLKNTLSLFVLYTLLSFWDAISILIGLPFIVITMVLGPLMVTVLVLASTLLVIYLVEEVVGYDMQGVMAILESPSHVLAASIAWVLSLLVLSWQVGKHGDTDWVMERAAGLVFDLRQRLRGLVDDVLRTYGHDP